MWPVCWCRMGSGWFFSYPVAMDFMTNQVRLCVVKRERTVLFLCILSVNCRKQAFFINLKSEAISYIIMYTHHCKDRIKSNLTCKAGLEYLTVVLCILLL